MTRYYAQSCGLSHRHVQVALKQNVAFRSQRMLDCMARLVVPEFGGAHSPLGMSDVDTEEA